MPAIGKGMVNLDRQRHEPVGSLLKWFSCYQAREMVHRNMVVGIFKTGKRKPRQNTVKNHVAARVVWRKALACRGGQLGFSLLQKGLFVGVKSKNPKTKISVLQGNGTAGMHIMIASKLIGAGRVKAQAKSCFLLYHLQTVVEVMQKKRIAALCAPFLDARYA